MRIVRRPGEITRMLNGKPHGRQRGWYDNGRPEYDHNYSHGKKHGRHQGWRPNGQPEYDHNYEHDEQHGRQRDWYPSGRPLIVIDYSDGKRHGRQQAWYEDGQPEYDHNYDSHGKWHGSVRAWMTGKLVQDGWYEHGVLWGDLEAARQVVGAQEDLMAAVLVTLVARYV